MARKLQSRYAAELLLLLVTDALTAFDPDS